MTESLLSNNTSNRFKFIMTPTREKNLWPQSQKWNDDFFRKTKDCAQHALVTYNKWALKVVRLMVTVRVLKVQPLEEIFIIYEIKPQIVY